MTDFEVIQSGEWNFDVQAEEKKEEEPVSISFKDAIYLRFICKEFSKTLSSNSELKEIADGFVEKLEKKIQENK